ncbi:hypothetical protein [Streptomyces sp. NPDC094466]|uniref:hypothetical protein n=1 Tax=Streptomyces sp. NPDC094466 TaxID=3366065 RepID=UPI003819E329
MRGSGVDARSAQEDGVGEGAAGGDVESEDRQEPVEGGEEVCGGPVRCEALAKAVEEVRDLSGAVFAVASGPQGLTYLPEGVELEGRDDDQDDGGVSGLRSGTSSRRRPIACSAIR